ncbi:MAG TPA: STAS domain-containing protein [Acidimicrobiales bacterium]|nr:STAS domain-containing protein [Acidimicrobiales bacterium]
MAVLHIQGELVAGSVGALRAQLAGTLGSSRVLLELSGVTWLDSVGLGALIGAVRTIHEAGGRVALAGARTAIDTLLRSAGIDRLVVLAGSAEAAYHSLADPEPLRRSVPA